jgi:hypothetical protein
MPNLLEKKHNNFLGPSTHKVEYNKIDYGSPKLRETPYSPVTNNRTNIDSLVTRTNFFKKPKFDIEKNLIMNKYLKSPSKTE